MAFKYWQISKTAADHIAGVYHPKLKGYVEYKDFSSRLMTEDFDDSDRYVFTLALSTAQWAQRRRNPDLMKLYARGNGWEGLAQPELMDKLSDKVFTRRETSIFAPPKSSARTDFMFSRPGPAFDRQAPLLLEIKGFGHWDTLLGELKCQYGYQDDTNHRLFWRGFMEDYTKATTLKRQAGYEEAPTALFAVGIGAGDSQESKAITDGREKEEDKVAIKTPRQKSLEYFMREAAKKGDIAWIITHYGHIIFYCLAKAPKVSPEPEKPASEAASDSKPTPSNASSSDASSSNDPSSNTSSSNVSSSNVSSPNASSSNAPSSNTSSSNPSSESKPPSPEAASNAKDPSSETDSSRKSSIGEAPAEAKPTTDETLENPEPKKTTPEASVDPNATTPEASANPDASSSGNPTPPTPADANATSSSA